MRWLFPAREVRIDSRCLDCNEPIVVRMCDDEILEIDPAEAVAHTVTSFAARGDKSSEYR